MRFLGINKGISHSMKELRDGGVALIENDKISVALMEERLTQRLREGGYKNCLNAIDTNKIDGIGISTCTEHSKYSNHNVEIKNIPIFNIDHHISHALCAFELSGFREAIVAVMDGGGNTLTDVSDLWWENVRQQNSYYYVTHDTIELIDSDFEEPFSLGYGELFRSMTYLLGFNTSKKAANVTALASYGDYKKISSKPFITFENGKLNNLCKYNFESPAKALEAIWDVIGYEITTIRSNQEITQNYCDFCSYVQWNVEESLLKKLNYLKQKYNVDYLCLSGGVALNCVLNATIIESNIFDNVYIPFCAGDHGQPLGNALALMRLNKQTIDKNKITPFLGTNIEKISYDDLLKKAKKYLHQDELFIIHLKDLDLQKHIAKSLIRDEVLLVCRGKSEYGLRALGNRSIIARADTTKAFQQVAKIKNREWFRPFAPIILEDDVKHIVGKNISSPYMTSAYKITNNLPIKYCCSVDNRSRIQTVSKESFWGGVLEYLKQNDLFPACLNTSLNTPGIPIVESIDDALKLFANVDVNSMVIGNYVISKTWNDSQFKIQFDVEFRDGNKIYRYEKESICIYKYIQLIRNITNVTNVFFRKYFALNHEYLDWLRKGQKNTTIRYKTNSLEIPLDNHTLIWKTAEFESIDFNTVDPNDYSEKVRITKVDYVRFGELTFNDASNDGFQDIYSMKDAFKSKMYPGISEDDWMTIYHIEIVK